MISLRYSYWMTYCVRNAAFYNNKKKSDIVSNLYASCLGARRRRSATTGNTQTENRMVKKTKKQKNQKQAHVRRGVSFESRAIVVRDIRVYYTSRLANRAGRRAFSGDRAGGVCARVCAVRGGRGGNEVRPGGRLVRGLCRCSWPAGPAWAATARSAVRLGRRTDGCAPRREKHAHTLGTLAGPAGGRRARAHLYVLYYYYYHRRRRTHTHTRILLLYEAADAHTYIHIIPILLLGVCRAFARGGRRR